MVNMLTVLADSREVDQTVDMKRRIYPLHVDRISLID
jgi:hypothetical protein